MNERTNERQVRSIRAPSVHESAALSAFWCLNLCIDWNVERRRPQHIAVYEHLDRCQLAGWFL